VTTAIDIYDPELYVDGPIHEIFAELRRTEPVWWQPMPGEPGYWVVLKHADVTHVARNPQLFSAETGGVILETPAPERLEQSRNMLLMMDPPRHTAYRKPLAESFKARVIGQMEDRVRGLCRQILAGVGDGSGGDGGDGEVEFVHDVAGLLPSQVVGGLFGIPPEDWPSIREGAEQSTSSQDPELAGEQDETADFTAMALYAIEFAGRRRAEEPRDDLTSLILAGNFGGRPMSDVEFGSFFTQLVVAGNDTTKTMLSSGLHLLLEHPDQLAELRADHSLVPGAVEEILRYANPLHYFRRTATAGTTLRGVDIAAGDKVAMWYTSANRDEDVFADPQRFDIHRQPNPHLSFGTAQHFCLGAHLARLEGRVFFEELLATFRGIEQVGEARRIRSNLNNGLKLLPVRVSR
jgi:cytochrome P450